MLFRTECIAPGMTRIWDVARTAMYLLEGSERALLVDTGAGVGDLKFLVESLTDKPVTVIVTHGHVDHAMGAGVFEDIRISPLDRGVYENHSHIMVRKGYVSGAAIQGADPALIAAVTDGDYTEVAPFDRFAPLNPGDVFDLGGVSAEILAAPGHTPGTVAVLFPELRMLLLGDACNAFTYLFEDCCPTVAEYRETLLQLKKQTDGKYDRTLFCHGPGEGAPDMIDRVIAVCDDILAGNVDNMPFRGFNGEPAFIAKAMDFSRFCRADGGEGNVVYTPDRVR